MDVYYPTSVKVLGNLYLIIVTLKKWKDHILWGSVFLQWNNFFKKKYFKNISMLFSCAAAPDPAIGIDGVESLLEKININMGTSRIKMKLLVVLQYLIKLKYCL